MSIFDKLSNLIFEEDSENNQKKNTTPNKKGKWSDIFFEEDTPVDEQPKKKKGFMDIFFEEDTQEQEEDSIQSTFFSSDEISTSLSDISTKIAQKESELIKLASYFKTVDPKEFTDSRSEYEAYLSLIKQLEAIKTLTEADRNSSIGAMSSYQLESSYRKFESDYSTHIGAIQSLCYLSELSSNNNELEALFSSDFTPKTMTRIGQIEHFVGLISQKRKNFDKKYSPRLYKELIESEYRLTISKLMIQLKQGKYPRKNPFASFPEDKKRIFETFLSKDIMAANDKYNTLANNKDKYVRFGFVNDDFFYQLDSVGEVISQRLNTYTIDDFKLSELLENGEGYETLKQFLSFKLNLNYIDSKTPSADQMLLDEHHRKATGRKTSTTRKTSVKPTSSRRSFPDFDDDL